MGSSIIPEGSSVMRLLACVIFLTWSRLAAAGELAYKWKKGDAHQFHFTSKTKLNVTMGQIPGAPAAGMPGMDMVQGMMGGGGGSGMNADIDMTCDFTEKILSVKPDGTADVELLINQLTIAQDGQPI